MANQIAGHLFLPGADLAAAVAEVITVRCGLAIEENVRLGSRADHITLVAHRDEHHIGVLVCATGSAQSLRRRCQAYAKTGKLTELIVVTAKASHIREMRSWVLSGKEHPMHLEAVQIRWV